MELEEHREAGRNTAVLTSLFGMHNLAPAEDVVYPWTFRRQSRS
jgi:hypothetical protein